MADTVAFELVSPERLLISEPVEMVVVPGSEGDFGVLSGHAPMISTVRPGVISIYEGGRVNQRIFVSGGFAEVAESRCTVLAEETIEVDGIDRASVDARLSRAREAVGEARDDDERQRAEDELAIAGALATAVASLPAQ